MAPSDQIRFEVQQTPNGNWHVVAYCPGTVRGVTSFAELQAVGIASLRGIAAALNELSEGECHGTANVVKDIA
jgi:hypothetical protein